MSFVHDLYSQEKPDVQDIPFSSIVQSAMGILPPILPKVHNLDIRNDFAKPTKASLDSAGIEYFKEELGTRLEVIEQDLISLYGKKRKVFIEDNLAKSYMTEIIGTMQKKKIYPKNFYNFMVVAQHT